MSDTYILADRGITVVPDPGGKHRGWTVVREGADAKGPFEEWIGTFFPDRDKAVEAALAWKFKTTHGEIIVWHDLPEMPDADTTVLVHHPDWDEPTWMGFHDGEGWRSVEAMTLDEPLRWAHLPTGKAKP